MKHPIEITLHPGFFLYLSAIVLLLPLPWLVGALIAGAIHELAHIGTLRLLRVRTDQILIEAGGAKIRTEPMRPHQELLSSAAGPAAGFLLALAYPVWPQLAVCGVIQSMFNLLPLFPFDGGRVLLSGAKLLFGARSGSKLYRCIEMLVCALLSVAVVWAFKIHIVLSVFLILLILQVLRNRRFRT